MGRKAAGSSMGAVIPQPFPGDPAVGRRDRCVVCSGVRGQIAVAHSDPFCRTECAKAFYK